MTEQPNAITRLWYRFKHQIKTRLYAKDVQKVRTITFWPAFDSQEALTDHYYRVLWYLHPLIGDVHQIILPHQVTIKPAPGTVPDYLDPKIVDLKSNFQSVLSFQQVSRDAEIDNIVRDADIVFVWRTDTPDKVPDALRRYNIGRRFWRVDNQRVRNEGSFYLKASAEFDPTQTERHIADSKAKFEAVVDTLKGDIGYIFGTGPNLSQVMERDFSDGLSIACNSMLKNRPLMEKLNPPVITMADPIFHAGASAYAGKFRQYLRDAIETFNSVVFVPMRDYAVYMANLDKQYHQKIIGVPFVARDVPNLDLKTEFDVTTTSNVMTLFLIPLICTLRKIIYTAGFDGRPLDEDNYFWKHDPASQINTEMDSIKRAHPAFFTIDYNAYYLQHIEIAQRWIDMAEASGHQFHNLTFSHVPALKSRSLESAE